MAKVVSSALATVFDEPYTFHIEFEQKRGKTEARLVFMRDGIEFNPKECSGGGVLDVAAFALRLACLILARPEARRVVVLDEPMKFVNGDENQARVGSMLLQMAEKTGFQFIIVSDDEWLKIGKVIEL